MANTQTTTTPTAAHRGASPIPALIVGLALLVFWVLASMLQIQTSEAFILKGPVVTFVPDWGVLKQPLDLVKGHLSIDLAKAVMWGWGIELVYLVCIVGYEIAHESVKFSNRHLAGWFLSGGVAFMAFTAYPDFRYATRASGSGCNVT